MIHVRSRVWQFRTICGAQARLDPRGNVVHRNGVEVADADKESAAECFTCNRVMEAINNAINAESGEKDGTK